MTKKILIGTLVNLLIGSIMASLLFMGLLGSMSEAWMKENTACVKEPNMVGYLIGSLSLSFLLAILLDKYKVQSFRQGFITAAWITAIIIFWFGIWCVYTFNAYTWSWMPYDIVGNTIVAAVAGGVVGMVYRKLDQK